MFSRLRSPFFQFSFIFFFLFILAMVETTVAIQTGNKTGNGNQIDISHPFYLHSSDSPGMSLVNFIFDGRGFQG